jgi:hypothetical protein
MYNVIKINKIRISVESFFENSLALITTIILYSTPIIFLLTLIYLLSMSSIVTASEWQKYLGGNGDESANSVQETKDLGYIVAGYTSSSDGIAVGYKGKYDYWIVKVDSNGVIEWQKCLGGSGIDCAQDIHQTNDLGYIVAGYTNSKDGDISKNNGDYDFWIVKLNDTGYIMWQKCLGGTSDDRAYDIQETDDGGYVVAGYTGSNDADVIGKHEGDNSIIPSTDFWIVKINATGSIQWQKCLGGSSWDAATSIVQTNERDYVVAGWTYSNDFDITGYQGNGDILIVKLSSAGDIEWENCLGGDGIDIASKILQASDDKYIIAGYTNSKTGNITNNYGDYDFLLFSLNKQGMMQWQKCYGGVDSDFAYDVGEVNDKGYIITGRTESFDISSQVYLLKTYSNGTKEWEKYIGGNEFDQGNSVQQTSDEGYIIAGNTKSFGNANQIYLIKMVSSENIQPDMPSSLSGPTSGFNGTSYRYTTSCTDPDGDKMRITISWGDGSQSEIGSINSSEVVNASHIWNTPGNYSLKAKATDEGGLISDWSPELSMEVSSINWKKSSITLIKREIIRLGHQDSLAIGFGKAINNIKISSNDE